MKKILVIGAGRIGHCIAELLVNDRKYSVTLADNQKQALKSYKGGSNKLHLDLSNTKDLTAALASHDAVISAAPFSVNPVIAKAALKAGTSYFDLTEDVETTRLIRELAKNAKKGQVFMPQCGLAPGFVGILAYDLSKRFDSVLSLKMRVGALPEFPSNRLMYNLTWSTEGLINEYCNACEAIKEGKYTELRPLEGLETFSLNGTDYEAFNTSGGLGTLCESLHGKVDDLTYKTIRYPGHRHLMDFLIHGLRLGESNDRRFLLKQIFETSIAVTDQDVVIVFVTGTGRKKNKLIQISEYYRMYHDDRGGRNWSAIQVTTASSVCAVLDMHFTKKLPSKGFVKQEDVDFSIYIDNPFCQPYRTGKHRSN